MTDSTALNGGSGNSTTPETTQNRCYQRDSEAAVATGDGSGNGFYVSVPAPCSHGVAACLSHGAPRWHCQDCRREANSGEVRCSSCNRLNNRTMRGYGGGIYWCGRIACLDDVRRLRGVA